MSQNSFEFAATPAQPYCYGPVSIQPDAAKSEEKIETIESTTEYEKLQLLLAPIPPLSPLKKRKSSNDETSYQRCRETRETRRLRRARKIKLRESAQKAIHEFQRYDNSIESDSDQLSVGSNMESGKLFETPTEHSLSAKAIQKQAREQHPPSPPSPVKRRRMFGDDEKAFREYTKNRRAKYRVFWRAANRAYVNAYMKSYSHRAREIQKGNPCPPSLLTMDEHRKSLESPDARSLSGEGLTDNKPTTKTGLAEANSFSGEGQYLYMEDQYIYSTYPAFENKYLATDSYVPMVPMEVQNPGTYGENFYSPYTSFPYDVNYTSGNWL
ncbi:hypothetical protein GLAREA_04915 [Glarea lozoyensis ATCC 20868]|uniref:Uncharacterized protein n=1 Tax=Glarea lozoyensis (strain ATCC 20868 / MF5171) TaxID=1116229 RepID=S3CSR5_GLAL2|nr:uncharacterized protein GLAREA_04915 [Glarea lozoyensis ATCC 20868]EPE28124.1 hypothetical protein GLAREA_04915 [Glarea lozoyensis ATCC 20868]